MSKTRHLLSIVTGLLVFFSATGQSLINFKAGVSSYAFKDEKRIESGLRHIAHQYGFDILLEGNGFYIRPGFHYQGIGLHGEKDAGSNLFRKRINYHQARVPLSVGRRLFQSAHFGLSGYAGGQMDFLLAVDENSADLNTGIMSGLQWGWHTGIMLEYRMLSFDLLFSRNLTSLIKTREDSVAGGFGVAIGFML